MSYSSTDQSFFLNNTYRIAHYNGTMKKIVSLFAAVCCSLLFVSALPINSFERVFASADPETSAKAAYLAEAGGGQIIYAENENARMPIASMTKIMLLNYVFESIESGELKEDEDIVVSEAAESMGGSQVFLRAGESYKVGDLVKSVIVSSANDSSVCLAERLFGSEAAAVDAMNERCGEWGLANTLFSNVTGLPKPTQYSSAKDVSVMLDKLVSHEGYFGYASIYLDEIAHADGTTTMLTNTNKLVKYYDGCDGGKTGFTSDAGYCLAATAKRGDLRVVGVVIGEADSKTRFKDVSSLFDHAFNNYSRKILFDKEEPIEEKIKVVKGVADQALVVPENDVYAFTKKGEKCEFTFSISLNDSVVAPAVRGDAVGTLTVYKDGAEYKKINVVLAENVDKLTLFGAFDKISSRW